MQLAPCLCAFVKLLCCPVALPQVVIFPKTPEHLKTPTAEEAFNPNGLAQRTISLLKDTFPDLEVRWACCASHCLSPSVPERGGAHGAVHDCMREAHMSAQLPGSGCCSCCCARAQLPGPHQCGAG